MVNALVGLGLCGLGFGRFFGRAGVVRGDQDQLIAVVRGSQSFKSFLDARLCGWTGVVAAILSVRL